MENATCNVIYVDRNVREDRIVRPPADSPGDGDKVPPEWETPSLAENVSLILNVFGDVHLCSNGPACLSKLLDLQDTARVELKPTLIILDTPYDDRISVEKPRSRSPSPHSNPPEDEEAQNGESELYGLALLQRLVSESYMRNISKLVLPVPLVVFPPPEHVEGNDGSADPKEEVANGILLACSSPTRRAANRRLLKRCLDLGATDVMSNPMNIKCITNLEVHAYRAYRDTAREQKAVLEVRRGRKRSWVGVNEEKPFAYLREAMVSGLMNGICRISPEHDDRVANVRVYVSPESQARVAAAVGQWHFCAHEFSDDELVIAASIMFKHALSMPELEKWRLPTDQLNTFLVACRAAYNTFVPYHNFRHVVDVLQATFNFLVHIGALVPYPSTADTPVPLPVKSPMASLLTPFEALTLLITAIGHDVGHPGVNNGFLVKLNAPLAQLYNDRSVLESFHCAAYSQILRRHWPSAFQDTDMRNLMISSILATDMQLHFDYMKKMGDVQEKLQENNTTDGWNGRMLEEQKALACSLLIKCADICNVARKHDTALRWMDILADEFSRQAAMESELDIPSSLMAPPKRDIISAFQAQLGFMNMFAIPLFQGVADLMPSMKYCVDELEKNKGLFEAAIASEQSKEDPIRRLLQRDGTLSPRTMSIALPSESKAATPKVELAPSPMIAEALSSATKELAPQQASPVNKPSHVPALPGEYKEVNGIVTSFDAVADFAASDPFNVNESRQGHPTKQRHSETTEGSSSAPYSGDWASQATSATTGKMPLSPSTQGTSIVSRDSLDRPVSVPVTTISAPDSTTTRGHSEPKFDANLAFEPPMEEGSSVHGNGKAAEDKSLKKRPSRFRMNAFTFFRRHKGTTPPMPAADTAG